jgi:hypothetical protein
MLNFFTDRGKKTNGTGSKCQAGDMAEINGGAGEGAGWDSSIRARKVLEVVRVRAGPVVPKNMYNFLETTRKIGVLL